MTRRADRLNAVAIAAAILCLLPLRLLIARTPAPTLQGGSCGQSLSALEQLKGNVGLDSGMANQAGALADGALQARPPSPEQIQQLAESSMESLSEAADQLDQVAEQIGQRLQAGNLARQSRSWNSGVNNLRSARTNMRSAIRREPGFARPQNIGSLSATGVGPRVVYEAVETYEHAVESLGSIAEQSGFQALGGAGITLQGRPDMSPPPNPLPDLWDEYLRRLRAQQALAKNAARGVRSARALHGQQFQQAKQFANEMQQAVQEAAGMANQLQQLLGPCSALNANQNSGGNQQPAQSTPPAGQAAAAASAGGGMGAPLAVLGLAAAGGAGYLAYQQLNTCGAEPEINSNFNACAAGNCGACVIMVEELDPYCNCLEKKGDVPGGICGDIRDAVADLRRACAPAKQPAPQPAPPRR